MQRSRLLLLLLPIALLPACNITDASGDDPEVSAALEQPFMLTEGEVAYIESEDISVSFVDAREDSRCPTDVECFWEGRVVLEMQLKQGEESSETVEITGFLAPASDSSLTAPVNPYTLFLDRLDPYPQSDNPGLGQKTGTFRVSKTNESDGV